VVELGIADFRQQSKDDVLDGHPAWAQKCQALRGGFLILLAFRKGFGTKLGPNLTEVMFGGRGKPCLQTMNHLVCGDSFQVLRDSIKDACVDLICLEGCRNHSLCIVDPVRAAPLAVGKRWIHAGSSPAKGSDLPPGSSLAVM